VLLAHALIRRFAPGRALTLTAEAEAAIESHSWPGNVRELENRIKRACIMKDGDTIFASDLELESPQDGNEGPVSDLPLNLRTVRDRAEREAIEAALRHADLNLAKTARLLGVSRPTLYNLLDKHRIELGDRR
jgi:two-component system NtrC family response regulator